MHYARPSSIKDAVGLLAAAKGNAFVLAGGSDLLVRMKGGFVEPDLIVDIKKIDGLGEIKKAAGGFRIGAAVPCAAMGEAAALKKAWPGVVEAANLIGSKQVQGRCTIVGNLCNASPAADSVPALVAAGAKAVIAGPKRKRTIAVEKVTTAPGKTSGTLRASPAWATARGWQTTSTGPIRGPSSPSGVRARSITAAPGKRPAATGSSSAPWSTATAWRG